MKQMGGFMSQLRAKQRSVVTLTVNWSPMKWRTSKNLSDLLPILISASSLANIDLVVIINSNTTKVLIGMLFKKLLESKDDGITKDVIATVLDAAVASKRNDLTEDMVSPLRSVL